MCNIYTYECNLYAISSVWCASTISPLFEGAGWAEAAAGSSFASIDWAIAASLFDIIFSTAASAEEFRPVEG